ncbi:hypothetical protein OIV83_003171 [Microbotryomycetes sp. JL201]|nr:hypothetical protein OIV83_003171 [Microbotryomycetes sp. JL201]
MAALVEHLVDFVEPYMPSAMSNALYAVVDKLPDDVNSMLDNPTQLLSLVVSMFAVYAAFLSMYNTTRAAFRLAWLFIKLGVVASVVISCWSGYNGIGTEEGVTRGVKQVSDAVNRVYGIGKTGLGWWMGSGAGSGSNKASSRRKRRSSRQTRNSKKSASGARRTWSTPDDEGVWADPPEVDLGRNGQTQGTEDVMNTVKNAVLTFLTSSSSSSSDDQQSSKRNSRSRPSKQQAQGNRKKRMFEGESLTGWTANLNEAKRVWDDLAGGV